MSQQLKKIENRIEKIRREIIKIREMRPGTLRLQYRGKAKDSYGEYWQLKYTHKGKSHTEYVNKEAAPEVKNQIAMYHRFRKLVELWTALAIQHARMKKKIEKEKAKKAV
jgi:hypothetical protein